MSTCNKCGNVTKPIIVDSKSLEQYSYCEQCKKVLKTKILFNVFGFYISIIKRI